MVELRQLTHFIAVAEEESFTRGAERVSIVQSGISVSIRSLERELGTELFDRSRTPVLLTDAGRTLLPHARTTLEAAEAAKDAVAAARGGVRGTVRFGMMQFAHVIDLPRLLGEFLTARPQIEVLPAIAPGGSAELVQRVVDGQVDVAIVSMPGGYPRSVEHVSLGFQEILLACPEHHRFAARERIEFRELDGEKFIDFPSGFGVQQSIDHLTFDAAIRRELVVRVSDITTIVSLVAAGVGLAFLTRPSVGSTPGVVLVPVTPRPPFDIDLVLPRERHLSAAARVFADHIQTLVSREAPPSRPSTVRHRPE